jgi:hypothetical protein
LAVVSVDERLGFGNTFFDRAVNAVVIAHSNTVAAPLPVQAALYTKNGKPVVCRIDVEVFDVD